ncbi:hypothetical protein [Fusibacter sp. 3D3]|nr:hypothetical protein [Fusibacter sp. 3D3]GAU79051.1 hypothetical protein F3D3_3687 [Fusibacter sp. 3D3]
MRELQNALQLDHAEEVVELIKKNQIMFQEMYAVVMKESVELKE